MRAAVISSVYGAYDSPLSPPTQSVEAEWVLVSDRVHDVDGWRQVIEPREHMHPRLAAKVPKCRPDLYVDADVMIWIDGSFQITSDRFVEWCVDQLGGHQLAQFAHPQRSSIQQEAHVSSGMLKYYGQPVLEQADHYLSKGHPDQWGLWATGLSVRDRTLGPFGDAWLREQTRWTYQDQISQPPLLRLYGVVVGDLTGGTIWSHPMFRIRAHASDR